MYDVDVVCAGLVVVAGDDPRHAVIAEQQLGALSALVPAAGEAEANAGAAGADGCA